MPAAGVAAGEATHVQIHGQDYPTPDGTCIRDFLHVRDIAVAHLLALEATGEGDASLEVYNLGSAAGFSVREVVEAARRVTGRAIPARPVKRRIGDPPVLVADARQQLPIAYRNTIANMMAEAEALNGIFAADETTEDSTSRRLICAPHTPRASHFDLDRGRSAHPPTKVSPAQCSGHLDLVPGHPPPGRLHASPEPARGAGGHP